MPVAQLPTVRAIRVWVGNAPTRPVRTTSRRRSGRRAVLAFVGIFLLANVLFSVGMDRVFPSVRDPEYGRRVSRWFARRGENPNREFVALLGSSRMAMGARPEFANGETGPLAFNFAQVGSGPVMQAMTLRRLLHDGVKPDAVVLEYWPAFLREDGFYAEESRIDPHRLLPNDEGFVRDYFDGRDRTLATMKQVRGHPFYEHRARIICQIMPSWLPMSKRIDAGWDRLDRWGWLPGTDHDHTPQERSQLHAISWDYFAILFAKYSIHEKAKRATREILETCRDRGIPVSFLWLPESSEFRAAYPPGVLQVSETYLNEIGREYDVPFIDARTWVPDRYFGDGFHLTQPGAAIFSRRLGEQLRGER